MALLRLIPPCPPEFAAEFTAGGWRRVERLYNARTDLIIKWIELAGGDDLIKRQRQQHMRLHGVGPFGRAGGNRTKPTSVDVEGWLG